jgi:hypothetical protein
MQLTGPGPTFPTPPFRQFAIIARHDGNVGLTVHGPMGAAVGYASLDDAIAGARTVTAGPTPAVVIWKDASERFVLGSIDYHAPGSPMSWGHTGPYHVGMINSTPGDPDGGTIGGPGPKHPVLVTKPSKYPDDLAFQDKRALAIVDGNWALVQ